MQPLRVLTVAPAGLVVGALTALLIQPATNQQGDPASEDDVATFTARYVHPDPPRPWQLAVVESVPQAQPAGLSSCSDAVSWMTRNGAAGWSGDPVEVVIHANRRSNVSVMMSAMTTFAEAVPARIGTALCVPSESTGDYEPATAAVVLDATMMDRPENSIDLANAEPSVHTFELEMAAGEERRFILKPRIWNETPNIALWTLRLYVDLNGESKKLELTNGGRQFITVSSSLRGRAGAPRYEWCGAGTLYRFEQVPSPTSGGTCS